MWCILAPLPLNHCHYRELESNYLLRVRVYCLGHSSTTVLFNSSKENSFLSGSISYHDLNFTFLPSGMMHPTPRKLIISFQWMSTQTITEITPNLCRALFTVDPRPRVRGGSSLFEMQGQMRRLRAAFLEVCMSFSLQHRIITETNLTALSWHPDCFILNSLWKWKIQMVPTVFSLTACESLYVTQLSLINKRKKEILWSLTHTGYEEQ